MSQYCVRCLSSRATKLSILKALTDKPVPHYDASIGWCVSLLYRPIYRLQCYLEAASSWVNVFDVQHQHRIVVFHYTAITCLQSVSISIGASIGEIITETDTSSIGRYPIPDASISLSLFLLLMRYVPNVAKRSIWDQCKKKYILTTHRPSSNYPKISRLSLGKISNGHISARGRPMHFMFGSTVGFSGSADRMALFQV